MFVSNENIDKIGNILIDLNLPIWERYRALFTLENIKGARAADWIMKVLHDSSELLAHEAAYCLGQMEELCAIDCLISALENGSLPPIVRHEAAEALGAIADESSLDVLKKHQFNPIVEIAETCQLAIQRIDYHRNSIAESLTVSNLATIDPAPPLDYSNIDDLKRLLLDENTDLFTRYRAMFTLRNINSDDITDILSQGLQHGGTLFRHEIAFVLGQIQNSTATLALVNALQDEQQHNMVRHECAIALGSLDESLSCLKRFSTHPNRLISESCLVALDMLKHNMSDEFQYADKLIE